MTDNEKLDLKFTPCGSNIALVEEKESEKESENEKEVMENNI
jgi:hypothetical protein